MSSLGKLQGLLDKATAIAEEVEDAKILEKKKTWRQRDIEEHLRSMDRNSHHFVIWLSWLIEKKNFSAKQVVEVVKDFYDYVDEFKEFLEDWYNIKDEAPF